MLQQRIDRNRTPSFFATTLGSTVIAFVLSIAPHPVAADSSTHVSVSFVDATRQERTGKLLAKAPDGSVLLEDRRGSLRTISGSEIAAVDELSTPFEYLSAEDMAAELLKQTGASFNIVRTKNFVICSDASELYTSYCGRLLQKVVSEYEEFFKGSDVSLSSVPENLPVIIFRNGTTFQDFARQQHPETDFSDVPGYYSIRENQMLISAVSGDRKFRSNGDVVRELRKNLRQVETIVHEAVHQLAFNTGLQVRYGSNPMWFSEGLAVYFESASGTGNILWSQPGGVNRIHLPGYRAAAATGRLRLPLTTLFSADQPFLGTTETVADAYAEGWAIVYHLIRRDRDSFDRYAAVLQKRQPGEPVSADQRLLEIRQATGQNLTQLEAAIVRSMKRVRTR